MSPDMLVEPGWGLRERVLGTMGWGRKDSGFLWHVGMFL